MIDPTREDEIVREISPRGMTFELEFYCLWNQEALQFVLCGLAKAKRLKH